MFPVCGVQVVLLCRDPCLTMGGLKDLDWDLAQWMPLITDKAFVPWLVAVRAPGPHTACVHPTAYLHNVVPLEAPGTWLCPSGVVCCACMTFTA